MEAIRIVEAGDLKRDRGGFKPGDTVKVMVKVVEGEKERLQAFEGVVIRRRGGGTGASFTVRRISYGVGVERTFPVHSPRIDKIQVMKRATVRRSKLYYLRDLVARRHASKRNGSRWSRPRASTRARPGRGAGSALPVRERRLAAGGEPSRRRRRGGPRAPRGAGGGGGGGAWRPGSGFAGSTTRSGWTRWSGRGCSRSFTRGALGVGVAVVDHLTIDRINILQATRLAMAQALGALALEPELVLTDFVEVPGLRCPQRNWSRAIGARPRWRRPRSWPR